MRKWYAVPGMIIGSFAVYCSQSVLSDNGQPGGPGSDSGFFGDGPVTGDAHAQGMASCCKPPVPKFTTLVTVDFASKAQGTLSAEADLDGYNEVVLYGPTSCMVLEGRPDAAAEWVRLASFQWAADTAKYENIRLPPIGRFYRMRQDCAMAPTAARAYIVGVKLEVPG